jgi:ribosomal protein S18 acetylase RimI-like enzyme
MAESRGGYRVSQAMLRDVHAIRQLEQLIFPLDAYTYLSLTTLLMWPGGANYKAVDSRGTLVGFVAGSPNWGTHIDWIVTLGIHPDHQRRGLGRWLLSVCESHMSQSIIRLTVRATNTTAFALYESTGYRRAYIEPRYYSDGEDGIVMEKMRQYDDEDPDDEDHDDLSA